MAIANPGPMVGNPIGLSRTSPLAKHLVEPGSRVKPSQIIAFGSVAQTDLNGQDDGTASTVQAYGAIGVTPDSVFQRVLAKFYSWLV